MKLLAPTEKYEFCARHIWFENENQSIEVENNFKKFVFELKFGEKNYIISSAFVGASIPWIQIDNFTLEPSAIRLAQLQCGHTNKPVGRWRYHRYKRHQMMLRINTKYSKRFSRYIWIGQTTRLDDCTDAVTLSELLDQSFECFRKKEWRQNQAIRNNKK